LLKGDVENPSVAGLGNGFPEVVFDDAAPKEPDTDAVFGSEGFEDVSKTLVLGEDEKDVELPKGFRVAVELKPEVAPNILVACDPVDRGEVPNGLEFVAMEDAPNILFGCPSLAFEGEANGF
jgi:hypothetical protein